MIRYDETASNMMKYFNNINGSINLFLQNVILLPYGQVVSIYVSNMLRRELNIGQSYVS